MKYIIEKTFGEVKLTKFNLFIEDTEDMEEIEYWEDRLELLNQDYTVAYRYSDKGRVLYSIFCNTSKKGSIFK